MRTTLCQSWAILFSAFLATAVMAEDRLDLTWRVTKEADFDSLVWNQVEIPLEVAFDFERLKEFLVPLGPKSAPFSVHVAFPDRDGPVPVFPRLPGNLFQLFTSATSLDRKVEYSWKGHNLRRYCIRCSSKGTRDDPRFANYWLDEKHLGTWDEARKKFIDYSWKKGAVVDILFDAHDILSGSGIGLSLLPDLEKLFWENNIVVNKHFTFRKPGDR